MQLREAVRSPERAAKRLRIYVFSRHMHQPQPGTEPSAGLSQPHMHAYLMYDLLCTCETAR